MPSSSILIEITSLSRHERAQRKSLEKLLAQSGLKGMACDGISPVYRIEGNIGRGEAETAALELLCDPIVEKYSIDPVPVGERSFFADVWFKPGVTDATGDSVLQAIADLKIETVGKAFSGTRYRVSSRGPNGDTQGKLVRFVNRELLNPLIQECRITRP